MIADRRFEKAPFNARLAVALAVSATLMLVAFGVLLYVAAVTIDGQRIPTHCGELWRRADGAEPAEKVRLLQGYHEAYCD